MRFRVTLLCCLLAAPLACSDATGPTPIGQWGGPDASLTLSAAGGTLGYGCGRGTIDPGWTVTGEGRFSASGQHFFTGGPVPPQGPPPHPALYAGQIQGDHLLLAVTLTDLQQTLGPFTLTRGGPPVVDQCS
jgi:hypothetical protein